MGSRCSRLERLVLLAVASSGGAAAGCAPTVATPRDTLRSFAKAYAAKDAAAMARFLSPEARAQSPGEQLARLATSPDAEEARDLQAALRAAAEAPITAEAGPADRRFDLVWSEDSQRWLFRTSPLQSFDLSTPRGALWALVHAVERQRWDVLLSLAPAARRRSLDVETLRAYWTGPASAAVRGVWRDLRAALGTSGAHPVVDLGLEAHFPFSEHAEAFLVKEDGLWRVDDLEIAEGLAGSARE